ncbi:DUF6941 family protein [Nocardioides marmorisolisilvae]|uniref:DUF6941 family protein n=1 Tax=Nocardioides marmorisolisilvae TaxID=1542737 RepID=UPI0011CD6DF4|nr:hypothetical protein [Nocardioides marmorisolisilvae]
MQLDVVLCDYGQVSGDKLFINGGGIDRMYVPDGPGPYVVNFSVAGTVTVPPSQAAGNHVLGLRLETEDDEPARLFGEAAGGTVGGELHLNGSNAPVIDDQTISFAFNFQGVPLAELGGYELVCSLDGDDLRRIFFRVEAVAQS